MGEAARRVPEMLEDTQGVSRELQHRHRLQATMLRNANMGMSNYGDEHGATVIPPQRLLVIAGFTGPLATLLDG